VAAVGVDLPGVAERLDARAAMQSSAPMASLARPDDLAVVGSSGGTTGVPKGSCRSFVAYSAMAHAPSPPDRRQLINGPLAYLSQVLVDMTLLGGGTVVLEQSFDAAGTLATVERERITDLVLVEPQLFEMMDHPDVARRDLSSLRTITHIGASAPPLLRRRARERLGPVIAHTYGASEMGVVSSLGAAEHDLAVPELFNCAGRIRANVEVQFRRMDGGLADGAEPGVIEVRSAAMASGYRNRPDEAFRDGWYRTGDLGFRDEAGYLHVLGRAADIAWTDGSMISPTLVEETLCQLEGVRYASVVVDHAIGHWIALVVPWPGSSIETTQCRAAIAVRWGLASAAKMVIATVERVPLTEQGKPDRVAICQLGTR
jgi:acyl-CoA synthetase (AMP-forming)/AMP-acid ligase II